MTMVLQVENSKKKTVFHISARKFTLHCNVVYDTVMMWLEIHMQKYNALFLHQIPFTSLQVFRREVFYIKIIVNHCQRCHLNTASRFKYFN